MGLWWYPSEAREVLRPGSIPGSSTYLKKQRRFFRRRKENGYATALM